MLVLSFPPTVDVTGTKVWAMFGSKRRNVAGVDALHGANGCWLFSAFLERDAQIMDAMQFSPRLPLHGNEPLRHFLEFLNGVPSADGAWDRDVLHGPSA